MRRVSGPILYISVCNSNSKHYEMRRNLIFFLAIIPHHHQPPIVPFRSVIVATIASSQARINSLHQVGRDRGAELLDVGAINALDIAKSDVDNLLVLEEEVLCDLRGTWVGAVERADEASWLAVVVELEVDGTNWEDGALEWTKSCRHLGGLAALGAVGKETVLEHEAGLDTALNNGHEF